MPSLLSRYTAIAFGRPLTAEEQAAAEAEFNDGDTGDDDGKSSSPNANDATTEHDDGAEKAAHED